MLAFFHGFPPIHALDAKACKTTAHKSSPMHCLSCSPFSPRRTATTAAFHMGKRQCLRPSCLSEALFTVLNSVSPNRSQSWVQEGAGRREGHRVKEEREGRERKREGRETERGSGRVRKGDRQTRRTERERGRQTDRQTEKEADRQRREGKRDFIFSFRAFVHSLQSHISFPSGAEPESWAPADPREHSQSYRAETITHKQVRVASPSQAPPGCWLHPSALPCEESILTASLSAFRPAVWSTNKFEISHSNHPVPLPPLFPH